MVNMLSSGTKKINKLMTNDFLEDFTDACEKEKEPYLVLHRVAAGGARVTFNTDNWHIPNKLNASELDKQRDMLEAIKAAIYYEE